MPVRPPKGLLKGFIVMVGHSKLWLEIKPRAGRATTLWRPAPTSGVFFKTRRTPTGLQTCETREVQVPFSRRVGTTGAEERVCPLFSTTAAIDRIAAQTHLESALLLAPRDLQCGARGLDAFRVRGTASATAALVCREVRGKIAKRIYDNVSFWKDCISGRSPPPRRHEGRHAPAALSLSSRDLGAPSRKESKKKGHGQLLVSQRGWGAIVSDRRLAAFVVHT